jgi:hypothetical protein
MGVLQLMLITFGDVSDLDNAIKSANFGFDQLRDICSTWSLYLASTVINAVHSATVRTRDTKNNEVHSYEIVPYLPVLVEQQRLLLQQESYKAGTIHLLD